MLLCAVANGELILSPLYPDYQRPTVFASAVYTPPLLWKEREKLTSPPVRQVGFVRL